MLIGNVRAAIWLVVFWPVLSVVAADDLCERGNFSQAEAEKTRAIFADADQYLWYCGSCANGFQGGALKKAEVRPDPHNTPEKPPIYRVWLNESHVSAWKPEAIYLRLRAKPGTFATL